MLGETRTFIICELSQTHEGSMSLAKMLVKAAAEAKADAVKIQIFSADELAVPSYKYYSLFQQLEWPEVQWRELIDYTHEFGIKFFADVFGTVTLAMLLRNGVDGIKLHGTDMRNFRLLKALSDIDLPVLLSIGGGTLEETKRALSILNAKTRKPPIVLMHGFQSYPTLVEDTNLNKMNYFRDQLGLPVGFADHIDGIHQLNFGLCAMAVGMGASVIEKHITISRTLKMEDYESALCPEDFVDFVAKVRELDSARGKYSDELIEVEAKYRASTRKHVVAAVPLKTGMVIKEEDVTLRRAHAERAPSDQEEVIGKRAEKDYAINDIVNAETLK